MFFDEKPGLIGALFGIIMQHLVDFFPTWVYCFTKKNCHEGHDFFNVSPVRSDKNVSQMIKIHKEVWIEVDQQVFGLPVYIYIYIYQ